MSKELIQGRIQAEIVGAISTNSVTPQVVGSILNNILDFYSLQSYKKLVVALTLGADGTYNINYLENNFGYEPLINSPGNGNFYLTFQEVISLNKLYLSGNTNSNSDSILVVSNSNIIANTMLELSFKKYFTDPDFSVAPFLGISNWVFELRLYPGSIPIDVPEK